MMILTFLIQFVVFLILYLAGLYLFLLFRLKIIRILVVRIGKLETKAIMALVEEMELPKVIEKYLTKKEQDVYYKSKYKLKKLFINGGEKELNYCVHRLKIHLQRVWKNNKN